MNNEALVIMSEIKKKQKKIFQYNKIINENKNDIKNLKKELFTKCDHEWVYDEWANFDDKCKYVCKYCGLYKNPLWN
tara:strand:+ start:114 stop:344 length:231 start_codon:yes stop_codon:yes gene_type:complete